MGNFILGFIVSVILVVTIYFIYRAIKNAESLAEKIGDIVIAMILLTIVIIYYLDRFNIPTQLGWDINVDSQNWFDFIGNYTTGMISASISALVSVGVTIYQIKQNNEDNDKRDKENLRIQNMPLLKYDCVKRKNTTIGLTQLDTNIAENDGVVQQINLSLKNIGLNTIRKYYIKIKSDILEHDYNFRIINENVIEKGKEIIIPFVLRIKTNQTYNFEIIVYYQDLLFNAYEQKVLLEYNLTSINDGLNYIDIYNFDVHDETPMITFPEIELENIS